MTEDRFALQERCGCNCKVCLEEWYASDKADALEFGETFCPGPCTHTDEERAKGLLSILTDDEEALNALFNVHDGYVADDTPE